MVHSCSQSPGGHGTAVRDGLARGGSSPPLESGSVCWHTTTLRRLVAATSSPRRLTRRARETGRLAGRLVWFELGRLPNTDLAAAGVCRATGASGQPHRGVPPGRVGETVRPVLPRPVTDHRVQRSSALLSRTSSRGHATTGARSWTSMVGPLIVIGSNGSMEPHPSSGADWRRDAVVRLEVCLRRCTVNGQDFPRRCWRRYGEADLSRHVSEDVPKHEGGRAREAVCVWPRAPRAAARNASDTEVR